MPTSVEFIGNYKTCRKSVDIYVLPIALITNNSNKEEKNNKIGYKNKFNYLQTLNTCIYIGRIAGYGQSHICGGATGSHVTGTRSMLCAFFFLLQTRVPAFFSCSSTKCNSDLASARHFRHWRLIFESDEYFPYPIRHLNFQKIVEKCL